MYDECLGFKNDPLPGVKIPRQEVRRVSPAAGGCLWLQQEASAPRWMHAQLVSCPVLFATCPLPLAGR